MVLVSDPDAGRRRRWLAALRAAGVAVRGASGDAERRKALADGAVTVEVCSAPLPPDAVSATTMTRLGVPPDLSDQELVRRVREALARTDGDRAASDRP